VSGYWEMAAGLVLHGTLNEELFMEGSFSGEMFVIFAKIEPFVKELREKFKSPKMYANVETLIMRHADGPQRLKEMQERMAMFRKMMQAKAA
jgi:hypothetical protein